MTEQQENEGFFIEGEDLSMKELLEMGKKIEEEANRDKIVKAVVLSVGKDDVTIDLGMKSEIFIPISEFQDSDGNVNIKAGDEIEVLVLKKNNLGVSRVSYQKAKEIKVLEDIKQKFASGEPITAKVLDHNKGGYIVDIGVNAFMPMSQISFGAKKEDLLGNKIDVVVIEINGTNIIVSAKVLEEKLRQEQSQKIKEKIGIGVKIKGKVKSIKPYGAFIDIGGIDGLLHLSDMSWVRVNKPQDVLSIGDEVEVIVLSFDDNKEKIGLGLKQLVNDPWENISLKEGDVIDGKVKKNIKTGSIIVVDSEIEGFLHISDLSWVKRINKVSDVLKEGDVVKVKVLSINKQDRRISFGLKQIEESPFDLFVKNHQKGDKVFGKVVSVVDFGVFVELEKGLEGMIHVSDLSWENHVEIKKEDFKKGEELEVVILKINENDQKISLGLKQKEVDPILKYQSHKNYQLEILEVRKEELVLKLENTITALVPKTYTGLQKVGVLTETFEVGKLIDVKLVKIDKKERKLIFSVKDYLKEKEKEAVSEYLDRGKEESSATFGDIFAEKLKDKFKDLQ